MTYNVRHILVQHKYEAEDLLRQLQQGKKFEDLAAKYSQCPSKSQGGDLGILKKGKADPDFEDEVFRLQIGDISKAPVRTRFGYHLIQRLA